MFIFMCLCWKMFGLVLHNNVCNSFLLLNQDISKTIVLEHFYWCHQDFHVQLYKKYWHSTQKSVHLFKIPLLLLKLKLFVHLLFL